MVFFGAVSLSMPVSMLVAFASPVAGVVAAGPRAPAVAQVPYFVKSAAALRELVAEVDGRSPKPLNAKLQAADETGVEIVWRHEENYASPELEVHDHKDHVFFVTDGTATFTLGGALVGPHEVSAGEWKAAGATDARQVSVKAGDLIFIPLGTVHGRVEKGTRFTMLQLSFWPDGVPPPAAKLPGTPPPGAPAPASPASAAMSPASPPAR